MVHTSNLVLLQLDLFEFCSLNLHLVVDKLVDVVHNGCRLDVHQHERWNNIAKRRKKISIVEMKTKLTNIDTFRGRSKRRWPSPG